MSIAILYFVAEGDPYSVNIVLYLGSWIGTKKRAEADNPPLIIVGDNGPMHGLKSSQPLLCYWFARSCLVPAIQIRY